MDQFNDHVPAYSCTRLNNHNHDNKTSTSSMLFLGTMSNDHRITLTTVTSHRHCTSPVIHPMNFQTRRSSTTTRHLRPSLPHYCTTMSRRRRPRRTMTRTTVRPSTRRVHRHTRSPRRTDMKRYVDESSLSQASVECAIRFRIAKVRRTMESKHRVHHQILK